MMYKQILLATELANKNTDIEKKALELQQLTQAKLSIINVVEYLSPVYMGGEMGVLAQNLPTEEVLMQNAEAAIKNAANRLNISAEDRILVSGRAADEILSSAEDIGADLIIVGSHGRHGLQLLLGSTANAILHHAKCDVLALRIHD